MRISHETIYALINSEEGRDMGLFACLRRKRLRKQRKIRMGSFNPRRTTVQDRVPIGKRPGAVQAKRRYGDWESDLMEGRRKTGAALSVQKERKSQFSFLRKTKNKTSWEVSGALIGALGGIPEKLRRTMTYDNGTENAEHVRVTGALGMPAYFCDPYCS